MPESNELPKLKKRLRKLRHEVRSLRKAGEPSVEQEQVQLKPVIDPVPESPASPVSDAIKQPVADSELPNVAAVDVNKLHGLLKQLCGSEAAERDALKLAAVGRSCRCIAVSSVGWAEAYAQACGVPLHVVHAEPDWLSFRQVFTERLQELWNSARSSCTPKILMLEGVNRSPTSAWLQPWLDLLRSDHLQNDLGTWPKSFRLFISFVDEPGSFERQPCYWPALAVIERHDPRSPSGTNLASRERPCPPEWDEAIERDRRAIIAELEGLGEREAGEESNDPNYEEWANNMRVKWPRVLVERGELQSSVEGTA